MRKLMKSQYRNKGAKKPEHKKKQRNRDVRIRGNKKAKEHVNGQSDQSRTIVVSLMTVAGKPRLCKKIRNYSHSMVAGGLELIS